jgi:hypothetical protein
VTCAPADADEAPGRRSSAAPLRFCGRAEERARLEGSGGGGVDTEGVPAGNSAAIGVATADARVGGATVGTGAPTAGAGTVAGAGGGWRLGGAPLPRAAISLSRSLSLSFVVSRSRWSLSRSAAVEETAVAGGAPTGCDGGGGGEVGGTEPRPLLPLRSVGEKGGGTVGDENSGPGKVRAVRK